MPRMWEQRNMESGKPRGKQQYQCKKCRRKFIIELNYDKEFKRRAIQIFYEGNSGRSVGRLMKINKSTIYNWIKSLNKEMEKSKSEVEREIPKEEIEMD